MADKQKGSSDGIKSEHTKRNSSPKELTSPEPQLHPSRLLPDHSDFPGLCQGNILFFRGMSFTLVTGEHHKYTGGPNSSSSTN